MLSDMFPECIFHLYDPAKFGISQTERILIFNRIFTDSEARSYQSKGHPTTSGEEHNMIVLISDIRTQIDEESVWKDMEAQSRWHTIIQPFMSSLKFRLPWDQPPEVSIDYLDGDIYLPVWGRTSTTECRLFVDRRKHSKTRKYYPLAYEEEMSYFNRVIRPSIHLHTIRDSRLDRCYDCASEIWVL